MFGRDNLDHEVYEGRQDVAFLTYGTDNGKTWEKHIVEFNSTYCMITEFFRDSNILFRYLVLIK